MSFFRGAVILSGSQFLNIIVTFISRVVLVRILGKDFYGEFGLAINNMTVMSRSLSIGIAPAAQYFAGRHEEEQETVVGTSLAIGIPTALSVLGLAYWGLPLWKAQFFDQHQQAYGMFTDLVWWLPVIVLTMNMGVMFVPLKMLKQYSTLQIGAVLPFLVMAVLFSRLMPSATQAAVYAQIGAWLILLLYLIYHLWPWLKRAKFSWPMAKGMIWYGLKAWPNTFLNIGVARFANLLGSQYVNAAQLSTFVLAMNLIDGIMGPYQSMGQLVLQRAASTTQESEQSSLRLLRLSWFIFAVMFIAAVVLGQPVIILAFKRDFLDSYPVMLALLGTGICHALMRSIQNYFGGRGRPGMVTPALAAELVILVTGISVLGPRMNIWGLVISSVTAALVGWLISGWQLNRLIGCTWREQLIATKEDRALLMDRIRDLLNRRKKKAAE